MSSLAFAHINECASGPCQNGAHCNDLVNQYTCSCVPGYVGTHCETDVNECASDPCQQGGACLNEINQYTCQCVSGTEGTNCEIDIDECASGPCQNGGTCTDLFNHFVCACLPWYYEYNCASLDGSYSFRTFTKFKNHALVDKSYSISQTRSEIECLRKCLGMADCQSVNFKSTLGTCEIASVTKADHALDYISSSASAYFEYKP
ncbi:fibropellin-3-like [Anneissia japonica]|uniref:fibropellin-3-like n=1 Tax=Anneissia japonica TaxID=1529436 RepID=UPI0014257DF9|nr:fibropellin-3-like [Anneissia japonica]